MSKLDSDDSIQSMSSFEIKKKQTTKKKVIGTTASSGMAVNFVGKIERDGNLFELCIE